MKKTKLMLGDNMESLKKLPDNSIDSIVSDPPYGLSFMGKKWDYDVPSVEFWKEVYRVLKPGGHILSFGGTRTYHRMVVNIEDAGFEIRDQVMWLYGSGFPKSLNISKQIDKSNICEYRKIARTAVKSLRLLQVKLNEDTEGSVPENVVILQEENQENKMVIGVVESLSPTDISIYATKELIEENTTLLLKNILEEGLNQEKKFITLTELKTIIDLKIWNLLPSPNTRAFTHIHESVMNMGTSLKPANEPICVARKPLSEKTIADNVIKWGTGGINIDGCRIGFDMTDTNPATNPLYRQQNDYKMPEKGVESEGAVSFTSSKNEVSTEGRFPANIILDETAAELLDEQSGISKSSSNKWEGDNNSDIYGKYQKGIRQSTFSDSGGASRFFYVAKVSKKERNLGLDGFEDKIMKRHIVQSEGRADFGKNESSIPTKNTHPTLKPINLMTYLCRLITPEGGIVLDPFMGSGSTGISALLEGFRFVGMEMDEDYFKIAEARIEAYEEYRKLIK